MPIYYYGEGSTRIGSHAFSQMEADSDRAAGIVAGAMVERRLQDAIKSRILKDEKVCENLFRPSGPLGPFSVKIDMAYLLGIISVEGRADLMNIKDIRNDFAHHFDFDSFDNPSIKARCANLRLVEKYVRDIDPETIARIKRGKKISPVETTQYLMARFEGASEQLKLPRKRYIYSAMVFSALLGSGSEDPVWKPPYF